jgi:uncharacterized protein
MKGSELGRRHYRSRLNVTLAAVAVSADKSDPRDLQALVEQRRDEIDAAAKRHRIARVRIFGSVARGDHRTGSDIDFLVDAADDASLFDLAAFRREVEKLLGVEVDVVSSRALLPRDDDVVGDALPL